MQKAESHYVWIDSFIVELGRMCNRVCKHCLRGPMEDVSIQMEYVKRTLSQCMGIDSITFSGGEPTLYSKEIIEIINFIIENRIEVHSFYIASNGEEYNHDLMCALIRFYAYTLEYDDGSMNAYEVSADQFHRPDNDVVAMLSAFAFFHKRPQIPTAGIIAEGYASSNNIGYRRLNYGKHFYIMEDCNQEYEYYRFEMLYLNALGYLYADCDYSYETQRNIDAPHCETKSLYEIARDENFSDIE